jgi:hypothetical protein
MISDQLSTTCALASQEASSCRVVGVFADSSYVRMSMPEW